MKNTFRFSLIGLALLLGGLFAFQNTQSPKFEKQYMTLTAKSSVFGRELKVYISVDGEGYMVENLSGKLNQPKGDFDLNPVLRLIAEYERGGWKIISSNMLNRAPSQGYMFYYLMEREVNPFDK